MRLLDFPVSHGGGDVTGSPAEIAASANCHANYIGFGSTHAEHEPFRTRETGDSTPAWDTAAKPGP